VVLSGPIASFYGEPEVKPLFEVVSIAFFLTSLQSTQVALLKKEMRFRALEIRKMVGTAASAVVAIVAAAEGAGAWAIIASQLTFAAPSAVLVWSSSTWRPTTAISTSSRTHPGGVVSRLRAASARPAEDR
jgi:O-antigen/teichoic acid export membrane protein